MLLAQNLKPRLRGGVKVDLSYKGGVKPELDAPVSDGTRARVEGAGLMHEPTPCEKRAFRHADVQERPRTAQPTRDAKTNCDNNIIISCYI